MELHGFQGRTSNYSIYWAFIEWKLVDEIQIFLFRYAKRKNNASPKLEQYLYDYGDTVFSADGMILYCEIC